MTEKKESYIFQLPPKLIPQVYPNIDVKILKHSPWETVVKAAWQKYPNPYTPSVTGVDVIDRKVDKNGILHTKRVLCTGSSFPAFAERLIGKQDDNYAFEHSELNPKEKTLTLKSKNITLGSFLSFEELIVYTPHPEDQSKTQQKTDYVVKINGLPLSDYFENLVLDRVSKNAFKGRQAMEWKIDMLKQEAQKVMDSMAACAPKMNSL